MWEAPIHQSHVYGGIKISRTLFEKGYPRNIPVKLFQNLTSSFGEEEFLRISSCPYIVQEAPIHQSHVFWQIKISQTIEKGHPRNIPVKLFQNLTSGFRGEDFLRIFSCPYSARSPHSPEPCSRTDQKPLVRFWNYFTGIRVDISGQCLIWAIISRGKLLSPFVSLEGKVKIFGLLSSIQVFIADTSSFWSLRSNKQMDIKLFTEFLKKNDLSKNMDFMQDSFSSYGTK